MPLQFNVIGETNKGLVRPGNEDYLHIDKKNAVFAVCDGMGGHQAGEVASMMASEIIRTIYDYFLEDIHQDDKLKIDRALPLKGDVLLKSIRLANRAIYNKATSSSTLFGMGTTIAALALENDVLSVAHVGDSRAYRLDEKKLSPLTIDHSWVTEIKQNQNITEEEAASVVGKNVITRALGVRDTVEIDYRLVKVKPGDKFILCTDGLCGYADDDEIFDTVNKVRNNNSRMVSDLIQMACDRGGADNTTVVVIEILEVKATKLPELEMFTLPPETLEQSHHEDFWLEKINNFIAKKDEISQVKEKPVNKFLLVLIFVIFIIIAIVTIYYTTSP